MGLADLTDHDWLQIESAAHGCIDSQIWPDLIAALERMDSLATDIAVFDRSFVVGFCRGLMEAKNVLEEAGKTMPKKTWEHTDRIGEEYREAAMALYGTLRETGCRAAQYVYTSEGLIRIQASFHPNEELRGVTTESTGGEEGE